MNSSGWVQVETLLRTCGLRLDELRQVVAENDKQRFAFSSDGQRIRAVQGHSVSVDLGYAPAEPPAVLFHGTHCGAVEIILRQGLRRGERQFVHLSANAPTAVLVGRRRGTPVVLRVDTSVCVRRGLEFFIAPNGVWLIREVPVEALSVASST